MTGLVTYKEFAGDAKPAATAFAKTGYDFFTNWINRSNFSWIYFCNVSDA